MADRLTVNELTLRAKAWLWFHPPVVGFDELAPFSFEAYRAKIRRR